MEKKVYRFPIKSIVDNRCSWPGRVYTKELWADIDSKTGYIGEFILVNKQSVYEEIRRAVDRKIKILHMIYGV